MFMHFKGTYLKEVCLEGIFLLLILNAPTNYESLTPIRDLCIVRCVLVKVGIPSLVY